MKISKKFKKWLLPIMLILFILEILTLPMVIRSTFSGRSESPEHVLTYTKSRLMWDYGTKINSDGTAELSLFSAVYENTKVGDGSKILAPGTAGKSIVRLKNDSKGTVDYTAVLYQIKSSDNLPVSAVLSGEGFSDTQSYPLPSDIEKADILRAVKGTIGSSNLQDFDIDWFWSFDEGVEKDKLDNLLGDKAAFDKADDIKVGLYIMVEDNNREILPQPQTGETAMLGGYIALVGISGVVFMTLLISRLRNNKRYEI